MRINKIIKSLFVILAINSININCFAGSNDEADKSVIETYEDSNTDYFESSVDAGDNKEVSIDSSASSDTGLDYKGEVDTAIDYNNISELELKSSSEWSANIDVYITFENVLSLSLDTNTITFSDFSATEDVIREGAFNISVTSTLPYSLNSYLEGEIYNSDKSILLNKEILNIKEGGETEYKFFKNVKNKVVLKDNNLPTDNTVHPIDLKLRGGITHEKDVYKATIKFEVEQK